FVARVDEEIARCPEGKGAKRVDTATLVIPKNPRVGEVYVFRVTDAKGATKTLCEEIVSLEDGGRERFWDDADEAKKNDRSWSTGPALVDPEPLKPGETEETVEVSGVKFRCAKEADGSLRPLER